MARYADPNYWRLDDLQAPVFSLDRPLLAIAGPGSGKTRTIIAKAVRLIEAHDYDTSCVALVTFTKAAAKEMQERLQKALPGVRFTPARTYIGTFHALCYRMLRDHWSRIGVQRKVLTDQEIFSLVLQSAREIGTGLKLDELQSQIERYKSLPADYPLADADVASEAYQVFSLYEKRRIASHAIDRSDMVRECLAGIRAGAIEPLPVRYMLADEMQDADLVQIDWVLAHYSRGVIPTLVADDDQSIYAFRNAAGFRGLKIYCEAASAQILPMTYNYRSCTTIVEAASLIIGGSPDRFAKNIQARRQEEGELAVAAFRSEARQAQAVVTQARDWLAAHAGSSAAVIARTNVELDAVELACKSLQVPFIRVGASDFLKRPHVERALLALRLPLTPHDALAFSVACQVSESLAGKAVRQIEDFVLGAQGDTHVLDLASDAHLIASLRRDDQTAFREFRAALSDWFEAAQAPEPEMAAAIRLLLGRFARASKEERAQRDLSFLGEMLASWCSGPLSARLNALNQRTEQAKNKVGAITLCSAHASKGLEFDHVSVINADRKTWPHDTTPAGFFEEMRLFYVATTRAKDKLVVALVDEGGRDGLGELSVFMQPVLEQAASTAAAARESVSA